MWTRNPDVGPGSGNNTFKIDGAGTTGGVAAANLGTFSFRVRQSLNSVIARLRPQGTREVRLRLHAGRLEVLGEVTRLLAARRIEIGEINSQRLGKANYEIEMRLRLPVGVQQHQIVAEIAGLSDVEVLETASSED